MGYIAAALNRNGEDASAAAAKMLQAAGGEKGSAYGLASPTQAEHHTRPPEFTSVTGDTIIGYKSTNPRDYPPQPLTQRSGSLCVNATLYGSDEPDTLTVANLLEADPLHGLEQLIDVTGHHTAVHISPGRILCSRDPTGTQPLFIAENSELSAAASNRKMLWSLDLEPTPLKPGHIVCLTRAGVKDTMITAPRRPEPLTDTPETILKTLDATLREAARDVSRKAPKGALAFSGGIDSTLAALYLRDAGADLGLICVGVDSRNEYRHAQAAADSLGLDLQVNPVTVKELEEAIPNIVRSVEDSSPLAVGVAAPLHFTAKTASEQGHTTIFTGNGSDEVFGGYHKYHAAYLKNPAEATEMMLRDTAESWATNYDREAKTCTDLGLDLLLPFAHPQVIGYGLRVPIELKLPKSMDKPRKTILRQLAKMHGLPEEVWARPKKAAQYSTGVHKAMERLAKRRGVSLRGYLQEIYDETRKEPTHA
ncbi:MAG TPA: asparagine synthase-related protein [Candidatus Desulfaltia sp.]|nr:asparagine synthase-related protein [Candidatus Desulfaltia sp.]